MGALIFFVVRGGDGQRGKAMDQIDRTGDEVNGDDIVTLEFPGLDKDPTQTIDLSTLFREETVTSGSFDLKEDQYATFGKLLEAMSVPTLIVSRSQAVEFTNVAFRNIAKYEINVKKLTFSSLFSNPKDARNAQLLLKKVFEQRKPEIREQMLHICGAKIWGRLHLRTIRFGDDPLVLIQIENLTAQKELLAIQKYKKLVNLFPIGIGEFAISKPLACRQPPHVQVEAIRKARMVDGNDEFARVCKLSEARELFGLQLGRLLPFEGKGRRVFETWIRKGYPKHFFTTREAGPGESTGHFENTLIGNVTDGHLLGFWWLRRDISDKKRTEEEILKAHKLESLGILAGGIAHDFNNLLTAILGNVSLAKTYIDERHKAHEKMAIAAKATLRAQELTRQLLTFARGGAPIKKTASISELLKDCAEFVLRGVNIRTGFSLAPDLWHVHMDAGQISQVVNNLIINSVQALPEEGGRLLIRARNVQVDEDSSLPLTPGRYVRISISDNGKGIERNHIRKVFDPYFTTKERGSGLGLATSYSIIKKHEGHITLWSKLGVGTTFYFFLPASRPKPRKIRSADAGPIQGTGRVLVMDDEEMIRNLVAELLTTLGYDVACAADGTEAIRMYAEALNSGMPFDAAIIDLTIPGGMGGKEAVRNLLKLDPFLKAIVSSGHSKDEVMSRYVDYGFKGVLPKPYDGKQLSQELFRVIQGLRSEDTEESGRISKARSPDESHQL